MSNIKHISVGEELNSVEWASEDTHELVGGGEIVPTDPPSGYYKVTNLYCVKVGNAYKLVVEHEDTPV